MDDFLHREESFAALLQRAWVTEWSPRGAFYARRLGDTVKLNEQACLKDQDESDVRVVVNVLESQEAARAYIRVMKEKKRAKYEKEGVRDSD